MTITPLQVDQALQTFAELRRRYTDIQPAALPESCRSLDDFPLRIAVVGEIKKGKSSLLNALVGVENVSPVSSDIATSVVFRLKYSATEQSVVEFNVVDGVPPRRALSIHNDEVARYGTEDSNPGNVDGVDCITIGVNSPFLAKGFELLDTPGLGGLFASHAEVTWKHIPRAHFVLFVLDSAEAVMSRHEAEYLARLAKLGKPVFFVQTKADSADTEQVQGWRARNVAIISKVLGKPPEQIPYFCVSATMWQAGLARGSERHLQRSGFQPLMAFLDARVAGFRLSQRRKLVSDLDAALIPVFTVLKATAEANAATMAGPDQRQALEMRCMQLKREFVDWQGGPLREATRELQQVYSDAQRTRGRELRATLNPGPGGNLYDAFARSAETLGFLPQNAEAMGRTMLDELADQTASSAYDAICAFQLDIASLLQRLAQKLGLTDHAAATTELGEIREGLRGHADFSHVGKARNFSDYFGDAAAFSGSIGFLTATGIATGGVALLIGGVAAVAIIASRADARRQAETQQLKAKLIQSAQNLLRAAGTSAMSVFEDLAVQYKRAGDDLLESCLVARRREVTECERALLETHQQLRNLEAVRAADAAYREVAAFRSQLIRLRDDATGA